MDLNPRLAKRLEAYEPERLKAILMWFNADRQSFQSQSERLTVILDEMQQLTVDSCYELAGQLDLDDLVQVSILNEFGPRFEEKPAFVWLSRSVSQRLS